MAEKKDYTKEEAKEILEEAKTLVNKEGVLTLGEVKRLHELTRIIEKYYRAHPDEFEG